MDGGTCTVEIFDNKTYKIIFYVNPELYLEELKNSGLTTKEHIDFLTFVNFIIDNFNFRKLRQAQEFELNNRKH